MKCFLLYIDDWLASKRISMMDDHEERAYFRLLLCEAGEPDCALPDDDKQLAIMSGLGRQWYKLTAHSDKRIPGVTSGDKIRKCFTEHEGRLVNERLYREWLHQQEVIGKRTQAGKTGADARWHSKRNGNRIANASQTQWQNDANPNPNVNPNTTTPPYPLAADTAASERKRPRPLKAILTPEQEAWWAKIWPAYWRHEAKEAARKAFAKAVPDRETAAKVWAWMNRERERMLARDPDNRPHFATCLNQHRWNDEPDPECTAVVPVSKAQPIDRDALKTQRTSALFDALMTEQMQ